MTALHSSQNQSNNRNAALAGTGAASVTGLTGSELPKERRDILSFAQLHRLGKKAVLMSHSYCRNRREGVAHRAKLRRWIVPRLRPGCRIPSARWLAAFLHICPAEAARHMRRVLVEAGIATETRGGGRYRRVYVTAIADYRTIGGIAA